jgi:hypothetical protein
MMNPSPILVWRVDKVGWHLVRCVETFRRETEAGVMASVTVELSAETEQKLRDQAAQNGQTIEAFLRQLAEQAATVKLVGPPSNRMTPEQWSAEFRAWVASHKPTPGRLDDSRETIYEGRGE